MKMQKVWLVSVLIGAAVLQGCVGHGQIINRQAISSPQAPMLSPTRCIDQKSIDSRGGFRIVSTLRFINDTALSFQVVGPNGQNYIVCPNGGFVDFLLPHPITDSMYKEYQITFRSVGPGRAYVGNRTVSVGGSSGRSYDMEASYARQVQ